MNQAKLILDEMYLPDGYSIGINVDLDTGQTVMHAHIYLSPRYSGDVKDPQGGIRKMLPGPKGN
ncbi:HIT family protein [Levilactobacillus bambusae]|uniref:HIT family protein n=1 Tax=Levilactobacillus bambusae TaxID=2024736 RepID=UPI001CDA7DE8|nr:hypothetical protein [Levilactobacillus bambusae]